MAHFIGYLLGNRGEASRLGTKSSGITASAQGWSIGGRVEVTYDPNSNCDIVRFYKTNGSSEKVHQVLVAEYKEEKNVS